MANTLGYMQRSEQFGIMPNKQKLFTYDFDYFDVDEKSIKTVAIYTPYEHLQSSGFMFKHLTEKERYNVKLNEKMNLIEQTCKWDRLGFDFCTFYRHKNVFHLRKRRIYHPPVTLKIITNF